MKSINLKSLFLAALLACGFLPALASATPVKFDINGQFSNIDFIFPVNGTFTGTMYVDTSTDDLLSFDVLFPGLATFDNVKQSKANWLFPNWTVVAKNAAGDRLSLAFTTPQVPTLFGFGPGSLVDFAGGNIIGNDVLFWYQGFPLLGAGFSGTITPAKLGVPEPGALGMFGLGALLIGGFSVLRRRSYKLDA